MNPMPMADRLKLPGIGFGEPVPFAVSSSRESAKESVSGTVEDVLKNVGLALNQLLSAAIEKRTAVDFNQFVSEIFASYAKIMYGLGSLSAGLIHPSVLEQVNANFFCEMEAGFRDNAVAAFGADIRDQAMFTVWTLRKISDLSRLVSKNVTDATEKSKDNNYSNSFLFHGLRMRFGLDCLRTSIQNKKAIYPEVLTAISEQLRSAVDAYAWLRQAVDLRHKTSEPDLPFIPLDQEDREFLDASAYEFANEDTCP